MHANRTLNIQILVILTVSFASISPTFGYDGDVSDVTTIDTLDLNGPYKRIWQPHLAKWTDDHYLTVYGLELKGKYDMGDLYCSITLDRGKSWGPRKKVFDHSIRNGTVQYAYANPILFRPNGQDIVWLFAMRAPLHYRDSENSDMVAAYTVDGGYSWIHVELAMGYQGTMIIVGGIETVTRGGETRYYLPAHRNTRRHDPYGDRRQFILESKNLLKWNLLSYIDYEESNPIFLHEGKISKIDDAGTLKIVMRTARMDKEVPLDPALAYSSISSDGGQSWSVAQPEPELPNFRAKSFFSRDSNGALVYVYSDSFERRALLYKTQNEGGNWSAEKTFYFDNNRNSYTTLVETEPGRWIAVWDSSNSPDQRRSAIRFGILEP